MSSTAKDADVIIIGSGTGGLTAAAYLAVMGRRVVVVERQPVAGGNTGVFTHDGHEFDIGLHYLGGWRGSHPGLRLVLEPLGIDLRYRELDPDGFDEVVLPDLTFRVPRGIEEFRARLHEVFPAEREAIDRHLRRIATITAELERVTPVRSDPRSLLSAARHMPLTIATSGMTLGREFDRQGFSPSLRTVLSWCSGVYGLPPSRAALTMHAIAVMHYLAGAWYPEGGGRAVVEALHDVVERHGGEVLLGCEVERILVEDGAACGVRLAGDGGPAGRELRAPAVVSDADIKHTHLDLLGPEHVRPRTLQRIRGYDMPVPLFVVYLVLDRDLRAEGLPNRNWWVFGTPDPEAAYAACARGEMPAGNAFVTAASLKDPANERLCRPGQTNLQVMGLAPAAHDYWGAGDAYTQRKRQARDLLLAAAEHAIPGIGSSIAFEESASPLAWEHHLRNSGGTSYGIAGTPSQFLMRRPGVRTSVPGLFLAGASTRTAHGITGVAMGGVEAAATVAGMPPWPRVTPRVAGPPRAATGRFRRGTPEPVARSVADAEKDVRTHHT
jgi:phytoene dehydrogenase-like protein